MPPLDIAQLSLTRSASEVSCHAPSSVKQEAASTDNCLPVLTGDKKPSCLSRTGSETSWLEWVCAEAEASSEGWGEALSWEEPTSSTALPEPECNEWLDAEHFVFECEKRHQDTFTELMGDDDLWLGDDWGTDDWYEDEAPSEIDWWESLGHQAANRRVLKRKPPSSKRACSGGRGECSTRRCCSRLSAWDRRKEERKLENRQALQMDSKPRAPNTRTQATRAVHATQWCGSYQSQAAASWDFEPAGYQRWEPAEARIPRCPPNTTQLPDKLFELMHKLQFRDIDPNDFDLLMELAEYDSRKTISEQRLSGIPLFEATQETVEECADGCVFCAEEYTVGEQLKKLPCGHVFHDHCITGHLSKYSTKCPYNTGVAFGGCSFQFDIESES